ncbi:MAG: hypothetical protein LBK72_02190 [Bifidobacteriaceae bacterium]|jgi:hypothetical protein|nr:hypothetical protein [Bifidobacteriaceae bacterium]
MAADAAKQDPDDAEDAKDAALAIAVAIAEDWGIAHRPNPRQRIQTWAVVRDFAEHSIRAAIAAIPDANLDWDEIAELTAYGDSGQTRARYGQPPDTNQGLCPWF